MNVVTQDAIVEIAPWSRADREPPSVPAPMVVGERIDALLLALAAEAREAPGALVDRARSFGAPAFAPSVEVVEGRLRRLCDLGLIAAEGTTVAATRQGAARLVDLAVGLAREVHGNHDMVLGSIAALAAGARQRERWTALLASQRRLRERGVARLIRALSRRRRELSRSARRP
jgi:hypothetical protein